MTWQIQDAQARFSELLEATITERPRIVFKSGVETAMLLLPDEQWRLLQESAKSDLNDLLPATEVRTETFTASRAAPLRADINRRVGFCIFWTATSFRNFVAPD